MTSLSALGIAKDKLVKVKAHLPATTTDVCSNMVVPGGQSICYVEPVPPCVSSAALIVAINNSGGNDVSSVPGIIGSFENHLGCIDGGMKVNPHKYGLGASQIHRSLDIVDIPTLTKITKKAVQSQFVSPMLSTYRMHLNSQ